MAHCTSPILFVVLSCTLGFAQSIIIDDPEKAKQNEDFLVQGEYQGNNRGMQVIARGNGEFELVVYEGGLPGAGWDRIDPRRLDGDADVVRDLVETMSLSRVQRTSPTLGTEPPADAIVLFDGTADSVAKHWKDGRLSEDGFLMQGTTSQSKYQDFRLHLEFRTPFMPFATGQARGNSGIYHQGRFETQILDSFGLRGLNNEAGGIYTVSDPSVNACFPPLSWQTYDVEFTAGIYDDKHELVTPAKMSVKLNGILVQSDVEVTSATRGAPIQAGPEPGPIYLQDHGNPVRFRNIWIVPRDAKREALRPIVPGFERFHALQGTLSVDGGELLISSLACEACHASATTSGLPIKRGPDLSDIAERVYPSAIHNIITNPHLTKPGTSMPDPWAGLSDEERSARAAAITNYLLAHSRGELVERTVPPTAAVRGDALFHSIGCVACHASQHGDATPSATSVPFGNLAIKYTLPSLAKFLLNPHAVRSGNRMPTLTNDPSEASEIAAYLLRDVVVREPQGKFVRRVYRGTWDRLPDFTKLGPESTEEVVGLKLDDIRPQYNYGLTFEAEVRINRAGNYAVRLTSDDGARVTIADQSVTHDGVHPATTENGRLKLSAGVQRLRVEYFQGGGEAELKVEIRDRDLGWMNLVSLVVDRDKDIAEPLVTNSFQMNEALIESGRVLFIASGCAACHAFAPENAKSLVKSKAMPLVTLDISRGCLADRVQSPAVNYELTSAQRAAIRAAIESRKQSREQPTDKQNVQLMLATLNCFACHSRDAVGGAESGRDGWFTTTTPEMGNEGRLPPPLDGVGDKINDTYMATLLEQGANERPYLKTRMPGFGYEPLKSWHEAVNRLDRRDDMPTVSQNDTETNIIGAGRMCVGNAGLACIKCHRFGNETGGGIGAIDMLKMPLRLRPQWFYRYLLEPQTYRPGTRMPSSFVDGKSALTSVYDGKPQEQIDAMWRYLSLGTDAKVPEGLIPGAIVLTPDTRPSIYRNFFSGVSPRGIAVGYPGGVNLIWDAEQMSLVRIWKNGFVDASMHWNNRGQGSQQPLGDAIVELPSSFAVLNSIDDAWPSKTLRELGAKFQGYQLNVEGQPTFRFRVADRNVEEFVLPVSEQGKSQLQRKISIGKPDSTDDNMLVWRIATGRIQARGANQFRVDDVYDVELGGVETRVVRVGAADELRAIVPDQTQTELTQQITW